MDSIQRALGHSGTRALWHLEDTRVLGGHLDTRTLRSLRHLRHSGTWALRAIRHLGTWVFKELGHLGTRGTLFSRLHRCKVAHANRTLKRLCQENNFELINHENTITERHLNGSKLHLNKRGTTILSNNFTEAISNSIQWQFIFHSLNNRRNSGKFVTDEYKTKVFDGDSNLKFLHMRNFNKLVLGHLNINSLRNKFDALTQQIKGNVDILMLSETKLDSSFPEGQFLISGYGAPYRIDRTCHGGGIMLFAREDIPSKSLLAENAPIEGFYIEINYLRKTVANLWFL